MPSLPLVPRPFLSLALLGFALSAVLHAMALLGLALPPLVYLPLHMGVFVVWGVALLLLLPQIKQMAPQGVMRQFLHIALRDSPRWMRWVLGALALYAVVNFGFIMWPQVVAPRNAPPLRPAGSDNNDILRFFSGQWMLFYALGYATLDSYLRSDRKTSR